MRKEQYGWIPEKLGTIEPTAAIIEAKFDICCRALIEAAFNRDNPLQAVQVGPDFPILKGSPDEWGKILQDVPHRTRTLNALLKELKTHASKRFETKLELDQCRKQQHLIIAATAEMFIVYTHKHLDQRNWTDAHKAGLERQEQKKRDAQNLIREVPHGTEVPTEEKKIQSQVPKDIGTEITDTNGKGEKGQTIKVQT